MRTLRSRVGRVMRDVEPQVTRVAESDRVALQELIDRTGRILSQKPKHKNSKHSTCTVADYVNVREDRLLANGIDV